MDKAGRAGTEIRGDDVYIILRIDWREILARGKTAITATLHHFVMYHTFGVYGQ